MPTSTCRPRSGFAPSKDTRGRAPSFAHDRATSSTTTRLATRFETTIGRIIFNNVLPDDYPFMNYR